MGPEDAVIGRQALHAACLELRHPISGEPLRLEAPLPADMKGFMALLERYRRLEH